MSKLGFDVSGFLHRIGVEDKLNAFLDSEPVQEVVFAEFEVVKADFSAVPTRLPEKYRGRAQEIVDAYLERMDAEVFVESVLYKLSEDIAHSLHTLEKYLDITAVTQQFLDAVEEKTDLQKSLEEMAGELAYALKRSVKTSIVEAVSESCDSGEEFKEQMAAIFEGDEQAPVVITVEGAEDAAEALAVALTNCIFGDCAVEREEGCNGDVATDGECGCTEGACCFDPEACDQCDGGGKKNCNCAGGDGECDSDSCCACQKGE